MRLPARLTTPLSRALLGAVGVCLLALSAGPILARLLPPQHPLVAAATPLPWAGAAVLALALLVVLAVRWHAPLGRFLDLAAAGAPLANALDRWPTLVAIFSGLVASGLAAWVASALYGRTPLGIDPVVQLLHARTLLAGHLAESLRMAPTWQSIQQMVDAHGLRFGQFPLGETVLLAVADRVGAAWLLGPVSFGVLITVLLRSLEHVGRSRPEQAWSALLLMTSPFLLLLAGSYTSHIPALAALGVALWALTHLHTVRQHGLAWCALIGLGVGVAVAIRPMDGVLLGAVIVGALLLLDVPPSRTERVALVSLGGLLPMAPLCWANWRLTGSPIRFGYELLWGRAHAPGFHVSPMGFPHTPTLGLAYTTLSLRHLNVLGLGAALPAVWIAALVLAALALPHRARPGDAPSRFDTALALGSAILTLAYWAYWFPGDDALLGPRFLAALGVALVLWVALLPTQGGAWFGVAGRRAGAAILLLGVLSGLLVTSLPMAAAASVAQLEYRVRWADGVRPPAGAVVYVHEGWASQLGARLWALGVSHTTTDLLLSRTDYCTLELRVTALESDAAGRAGRAEAAVLPLLAEQNGSTWVPSGPTSRARLVPGRPVAPPCREAMTRDASGTLRLAPFLVRQDSVLYLRDLSPQVLRAPAAAFGRPAYIARPALGHPGVVVATRAPDRDTPHHLVVGDPIRR